MPRIVYGVLDIHRSHRIDVPKPPGAGDRADKGPGGARPDACTLCHVDGLPGGRAGVGPLVSIFTADPLGRAVAADALGRAPVLDPDLRARRLGALLASMEEDRYPAVRHLAWRGLRRLAAPTAAPGAGPAADYDPSADPGARQAVVERLRRALGSAARPPGRLALAAPGGAPDQALEQLEIGE